MGSASMARAVALALCLGACTGTEPGRDDTGIRLVEGLMSGLDGQQFERVEEILCPGLVAHLAGDDYTRSEFLEYARAAYETFPDFSHRIEDLFATGDRVVLRATDRATHAESGTEVSFGQISVYRIADGCIAEWWEEYDQYRLMQQLEAGSP